ncbi:MAG TPA: hypothetical protein VN414_05420 [Methanosarcina sp.]|nr:hypothetical protein [Methanosarcina sp.]
MPIGSGEAYDIYLNRYDNIIREAVEGFKVNGERAFDVVRADFISKTGSINKKVIQHIYTADIVVADLTELNPNVFYELGVRHSLRNGTILVALEGTKLPFDIQDLNVVFYKDRVGGEKEAIPAIQKLLGALFGSELIDDSPVFGILPELLDSHSHGLNEILARAAKFEAEATELRGKLKIAEATNLNLRDIYNDYQQTVNSFIAKFNPQEQAVAVREVEKAAKIRQNAKIRTADLPGEIEEDPFLVFVSMPFMKELEPIYNVIQLTADKLGLTTTRAAEIAVAGSIMDHITGTIARAGIIIADITHNNSNVMLEVGIAMSLEKKIIMIAQKIEQIPFDLVSLQFIIYDDTFSGAESLRVNLEQVLTIIKGE